MSCQGHVSAEYTNKTLILVYGIDYHETVKVLKVMLKSDDLSMIKEISDFVRLRTNSARAS